MQKDLRDNVNTSYKHEGNNGRNIELDALRCLLMFLIVLHHSAFWGYWKGNADIWLLPYLYTTLIYWHVDGFLAISGWFGVRFTLLRFLRMFGIVTFYSVIRFAIEHFLKHKPVIDSIGIDGGWFGNTYLVFMFFAPLVNAAIDRIVYIPRKQAYLIWAVFNIGLILNWIPYGISASGMGAFSIMTFVYVYVNVRIVRMFALDLKFNLRMFWCTCSVYLVGTIVCSVSLVIYKFVSNGTIRQLDWIGYTTYNSPHVILMAIAIILVFLKFIRIPTSIGRIVVRLAPCMFGVYLIHETIPGGRKLFEIPELYLARQTSLSPLIIVPLAATFTFLVCTMVDYIRRVLVRPIDEKINPFLRKLDSILMIGK